MVFAAVTHRLNHEFVLTSRNPSEVRFESCLGDGAVSFEVDLDRCDVDIERSWSDRATVALRTGIRNAFVNLNN